MSIGSVEVLNKLPDSDTALQLLKRACDEALPLVKRRNWQVPLIKEFYPKNAYLLGLNVGGGRGRTVKIFIRLRRAGDPQSFYPYEDVLGTVLHELVHCVHGPHDDTFNKLLDELWDEVESSQPGVWQPTILNNPNSPGVETSWGQSSGVVGGSASKPSTKEELRQAQLKALQKRTGMGVGGPRTCGGKRSGLSPAAAAAAALERRLRDDTICCTQQAAVQDLLNGFSFPPDPQPARTKESGAAATGKAPGSKSGRHDPPPGPTNSTWEEAGVWVGQWECTWCTFINTTCPPPTCEMCGLPSEVRRKPGTRQLDVGQIQQGGGGRVGARCPGGVDVNPKGSIGVARAAKDDVIDLVGDGAFWADRDVLEVIDLTRALDASEATSHVQDAAHGIDQGDSWHSCNAEGFPGETSVGGCRKDIAIELAARGLGMNRSGVCGQGASDGRALLQQAAVVAHDRSKDTSLDVHLLGLPKRPSMGRKQSGQAETWQCDMCTLINEKGALICGACEAPHPVNGMVTLDGDVIFVD